MTIQGEVPQAGGPNVDSGYNVTVGSTVIPVRPAQNAYPLARAEFDILLQGESLNDDKRYCDLALAVFLVALPSLILLVITADWSKLVLSIVGTCVLGAITLGAAGFWFVFRFREKRHVVAHSPYSRLKADIDSCFGRQIEALRQITVQGMYLERTENPQIEFKSKLRIVLKNDIGREFEVLPSNWESSEDSIMLQAVRSPLAWQVKETKGWDPTKLDNGSDRKKLDPLWQPKEDKPVIHIPAGRAFRTWIGLHGSVTDEEVLNRHAAQRVGVLVLNVKIAGGEYCHRLVL